MRKIRIYWDPNTGGFQISDLNIGAEVEVSDEWWDRWVAHQKADEIFQNDLEDLWIRCTPARSAF